MISLRLCLPLFLASLSCASPLAPESPAEANRLYALAIERMLEGQTRLLGVADRVRIGGADLCGDDVSPVLGVYASDRRSFDERWVERNYIDPFVEAATTQLELVEQPRILAVAPGLAGDRAGLRPGDLVVAIDGEPIEGRVALDPLGRRDTEGPVRLDIERGEETLTLDVDAPLGCAIPSRFAFGASVNAYATSFGRLTGVYFYSGLLRFFPSDDDLALIVGHELAHIVLRHTGRRGTIAGDESDADYLGLYFAARAGFEVARVDAVWRDFSIVNPYGSMRRSFYEHPNSSTRVLQQRATLEEIARKRARGEPLVPERGFFDLARPEVPDEDRSSYERELRRETAEALAADAARILHVSHRLAEAGGVVCGEAAGPVLGAVFAQIYDLFPWGREDDAEEAFGVGKRVTTLAVEPGSAAADAGLRKGDHILEVDDRSIRRTNDVFERARGSQGGRIPVRVERNGAELTLRVERRIGCPQGALVYPSTSIDTGHHRNKEELTIPTGLLRFARDEDELAIAISHQIGHHLLPSMRKLAYEIEADEIGLRIAHAAGYDVEKAPAYWDHHAAEEFWKISHKRVSYIYFPHGALELRGPVLRASVDRILGGADADVDAQTPRSPGGGDPGGARAR